MGKYEIYHRQLIQSALQGLCANPVLAEEAMKAIETLLDTASSEQLPEMNNVYEGMIAQAAIAIADKIIEKLEEGDRAND